MPVNDAYYNIVTVFAEQFPNTYVKYLVNNTWTWVEPQTTTDFPMSGDILSVFLTGH